MSDDSEEQKVCQTCSDFEPQTWRKSLCKNCFHSLAEHSPELLAHEAEVVAKEKAADKSTYNNKEQTGQPPSSSKSSDQIASEDKGKEPNNETTQEKVDGAKKVRRKYGAERAAAEGGGTWSWAIDLGRGYSKSEKPPSTESSKSASAASSTAASPPSSKPASQPPAKPTAKPTQVEDQAPTPSTTTVASDTTSASTSASTSVSTSKAKNVASKFESKAQTLPKAKPTIRPPEIRPGSASVAAFAGKLADTTSNTKTQPKTTEAPKLSPFKTDSKDTKTDSKDIKTDSKDTKTDPKDIKTDSKDTKTDSKDTKSSEAPSTFPRNVSDAAKDSTSDTKKNIKPTPQAGKLDDKISGSPTVGQLKPSPFGKDMLKSMKDSNKRDNSSPSSFEKPQSSGQSGKPSSVTKPDSSTKSVDEERKISLAGSLKQSESSPINSIGEKKQGSILLENVSILSETKVADTFKGKESLKSVASEELVPLVPANVSLSSGSKSGFEKVTSEAKSVAGVETVVPGVKLSEVGQRRPREEAGLAENYGYLALDTKQAVESIVRQPGHLANSTGSSSDAATSEVSGIKERVRGATSTDDVTVQGQNSREDASRALSDSNVPDLAPNISQEPETSEVAQENHACENTTSISSSPSALTETTTATATSTSDSTTDSSNSQPAQSISNSATPSSEEGISKRIQFDDPKDYTSDLSSDSIKPGSTSVGNEDSNLSVTSPRSLSLKEREQNDEAASDSTKEDEKKESFNEEVDRLSRELNEKDRELSSLAKQLSSMEEQVSVLEEERNQFKRTSAQTQKEDLEALLDDLRSQLTRMEEQCSRLECDNQSLIDKLRVQEAKVKHDQECRGRTSDNTVLEEDLEAAEKELEEVKDENKELQSHIMEMKNEMDEMYDHFRENEHDEFRELEKELDLTAKNCRILQFKLRKAERRNEQVEQDRLVYEDKLRVLQDQFDSQDAKNHIRLLEDELRMAKEVSVRLHDELDLLEDKRNKAMEESRHLTELLEHTDKRQFRMEMEIDKLRDVVSDLKQQLKEAKSGNNKESTPDRKVLSSIYTRSID